MTRRGRPYRVDLALHEQIKERLLDVGSGICALARELGIRPSTVTVVSQGYRRSERVQVAIAEKLGTTPDRLWPDRYKEDAMNDP